MDEQEIAEVIEAFALAAARVRAGGLDGVELLFAYGLLVAEFVSIVAPIAGAARWRIACASPWRCSTRSGRASAATSWGAAHPGRRAGAGWP
jgi:hypothetical protein